ncbi:DUF4870 domain-containing protein [Cellulomonas fengjieae]|uniref:DUF4870 domain-containing protein n=1 Tax=Cellulomonas fengjieae TaxID=2819978 RepID=UPI001AAE846A|nr:DUF4870 domain-containing protein [Cellulomonas fengjieae]MBO3101254.1 DUF4870 domain-containing protein [Cellulomonas fengjieae]
MSYDDHRPASSGADQARTWAMLAHLGGILAYFWIGWLPALVVWLANREKSTLAVAEARVALNFQLTVLIGLVVCTILRSVPVLGVIGRIGFIAISIASLVLSIVAALAVQRGGTYRYPYSIELVR